MTNPLTRAIIHIENEKEIKQIVDNIIFIWDNLVEEGIATSEELELACALCGTTERTPNQVLYIRTGYKSLEQMWEEEED